MAGAQAYDPRSPSQSPLGILAAPADPVAYFQTAARARSLLGAQQLAAAEPLIEQLVREYPRDGENWGLLARVKIGLQKYAEAADALQRAGTILGWRVTPLMAGANLAAARLAAGDRQGALAALRTDIFEHRDIYRARLLDRAPFASVRTDPEFLALVGRPDTTGWGRERGWRYDLDYLVDEVKRVNPVYHDALPPEFIRRAEELKRNIPRLSIDEFAVGMAQMLAALHQGHTELFISPGLRSLPVRFYLFPEGIFITDASGQYSDLVGSRVTSIGNVSAEEALRRVNTMQSVDGDMEYVFMGPAMMRIANYLKVLGVAPRVDTIAVTVESRGGRRRTVRLPSARDSLPRSRMPLPRRVATPLWLSRVERNLWEVALPEHDALYVQMNQVQGDSTESLPDFGKRLWQVLESQKPKNLILDVRLNGGGTTQQYPELLRTIVAFKRNADRRLYVLIGRNTYSATANLITDLERLADPVFVGEASAECCSLHGDAAGVVLPYTGIAGRVTGVKWNLSREVFDGRREMSPQVPVQLTARAYFAGEDPVLAAVFRLIQAGRTGGK
jgi:tetratricopeptide (TPR) repeat protein